MLIHNIYIYICLILIIIECVIIIQIHLAKDNDEIDLYEAGIYEDPNQIDECVTLSNIARSRWQNLLQLQVIKVNITIIKTYKNLSKESNNMSYFVINNTVICIHS